MSMNYRSAKKRGMAPKGKKVATLGRCMDQGVGASGYGGFKRLSADMAQGSHRVATRANKKLGESMNQ